MLHKKRLKNISDMINTERRITEKMTSDSLMVTVIDKKVQQWIYRRGKFYCRDRPEGIYFSDIWKEMNTDEKFSLFIFTDGKIVLDMKKDRLLIIE